MTYSISHYLLPSQGNRTATRAAIDTKRLAVGAQGAYLPRISCWDRIFWQNNPRDRLGTTNHKVYYATCSCPKGIAQRREQLSTPNNLERVRRKHIYLEHLVGTRNTGRTTLGTSWDTGVPDFLGNQGLGWRIILIGRRYSQTASKSAVLEILLPQLDRIYI